MLVFKRTDSSDPDFRLLVMQLDQELNQRYGADQAFFDQFNSVEAIRHVVVAYAEDQPVGCGAIKPYDKESMEVKRMFVDKAHRGKRIAEQLLAELEQWAREEGYEACLLQTADQQPEAIRLYERTGYTHIPNYGPYVGTTNSVCTRKGV